MSNHVLIITSSEYIWMQSQFRRILIHSAQGNSADEIMRQVGRRVTKV